ncbi:LamG domain-containing protein, partial [Okeania sp. SIO2B3]|uniref:LamG domain-containing protein n=1 Tax=Okeania sp. SIO2B3 TaxID=2607784 RepID=UPI0013BF1193
MSEVATKNLTFWDTTDYKYPGFGQTAQISDGLGGTIGITYNQIDYDDRAWKGKPDGGIPITEDRLLSGEIENQFSLTGQVKGITVTMPQIRTIGRENNYSVTLDFSNYKASLAGSKATDGATCGDTYLAISRFFNGTAAGYTTIKVTATTLDGSPVNLADWKLFNSGTLGKGNNARVFLDAATQTISGKNSQGKQEFSPTPPNPGTSFGTDTGLGLFQLPSDQRYTSITLTFKQKKIKGTIPNDLHDIYVASNTTSTSPISETPETKPMDINSGLQLHLPLNEIVENAAKEKEVVDISGNKLNGKVHGAKIVPDSQFGNCVHFDGVDDYIDLPKETIPQTGEITIGFWAYGGKSLPKNTVLISAYNKGNQPLIRVYLPWSDRRIILDYGNPFDRIEKVGEAVDFKDKWTYWTFTKNVAKGEMNIYLNGSLWHSGTGKDKAIDLDSVVKVMFGRETYNSFYNGQIAHLRIYDRVLSPEDINECMKIDAAPPPMDINSGLQLHLPLNEIVENAAKEKEVVDISGNKFNGKVHGAAIVADSRFGNCINFDGVDDYIELPTATIPQTGEITIGFWAYGGDSQPKNSTLLRAENNGYVVNIHLPWSNSRIYFDCGSNTNTFDRIDKLVETSDFKGKWTYWAFTKNVATGEMKIYLGGILWHSGKGKNIPIGSATEVRLGSHIPNTEYYNGKVANLRIYDRVLSPEEINECMKVDGTPPPMDINNGLQLHLPLDEIVENAAKEKEVVDVSPAKLKGKVNGEAKVVAD